MSWVYNLILIINLLSAVAIILLVLLQHGKGADMGAAFGSGASGSLFGATGAANLLSRSTALLAVVFFASCIGLAIIAMRGQHSSGSSIMLSPKTSESIMANEPPAANPAQSEPSAPTAPATPAAPAVPR